MGIKRKEDFEASLNEDSFAKNTDLLRNYNFSPVNDNPNPTKSNEEIYNEMREIASGGSNGYQPVGNSFYDNYQSQKATYGQLKDYDVSKLNENGRGYYSTLLQQANSNLKSAEDYYNKYLENEKSSIATKHSLDNAKANALKYLQNEINAKGYANQGVAESTKAGVQNTYSNNLTNTDLLRQSLNNQLMKSYEEGMRENDISSLNAYNNALEKDKSDAETERSNKLTSYLNAIENYIAMGDDAKANELYKEISGDLSNVERLSFNQLFDAKDISNYATTSDMREQAFVGSDNKTYKISDRFDHELTTLDKQVQSGKIKDGDVVQLTNKWGENIYLQYKNGKVKQVTENDFDKNNGSTIDNYDYKTASQRQEEIDAENAKKVEQEKLTKQTNATYQSKIDELKSFMLSDKASNMSSFDIKDKADAYIDELNKLKKKTGVDNGKYLIYISNMLSDRANLSRDDFKQKYGQSY